MYSMIAASTHSLAAQYPLFLCPLLFWLILKIEILVKYVLVALVIQNIYLNVFLNTISNNTMSSAIIQWNKQSCKQCKRKTSATVDRGKSQACVICLASDWLKSLGCMLISLVTVDFISYSTLQSLEKIFRIST